MRGGGRFRDEGIFEAMGLGSTFTVSLPARGRSATRHARWPDVRNAAEAPAPEEAISVRGMRVLIVDDEPEMRKMIATVLRGAGATVVTAGSAAEAFDRLSEQSFDVLVSDIAMPAEDGHSLVRRVRDSDDERSRIPPVALTAYGGPLQRQLALSAGFDDYVKKPFAPQELVRAVAGVAALGIKRGVGDPVPL